MLVPHTWIDSQQRSMILDVTNFIYFVWLPLATSSLLPFMKRIEVNANVFPTTDLCQLDRSSLDQCKFTFVTRGFLYLG